MNSVLLITFLVTATYGDPAIRIQTLKIDSGLYYEPLQDIVTTQTEWKIVTCIDLRPYRFPLYHQEAVDELIKACRPLFVDRCETFIDQEDLTYKFKTIEKYIESLRMLTNEHFYYAGQKPTAERNIFGERKVGQLSAANATFYDDQIMIAMIKQTPIKRLNMKNTHIVKPIYLPSEANIDALEKSHMLIWKRLFNGMHQSGSKKDVNTIATYFIEWKQSIEHLKEAYSSHLTLVTEIFSFANSGVLHRDLINPGTLEWIFKEIQGSGSYYETPASIHNLYNGILSDLTRFSIGQSRNKTIFEINFPLIDAHTYQAYRIHPLPISQTIGSNTDAAVYVKPRVPIVIKSRVSNEYSFLSEEDLRNCYEDETRSICVFRHPVYVNRTRTPCEIHLLTGTDSFAYNDCDVRIRKNHTDYWKFLKSTGTWLFSVSRRTQGDVYCAHGTQTLNLEGQGILYIREDCDAYLDTLTLAGARSTPKKSPEAPLPGLKLNITDLIPEILHYLPLYEQEASGFSRDHGNHDMISDDYSVTNIREYFTYKGHREAMAQQDKDNLEVLDSATTIVGLMVLAFLTTSLIFTTCWTVVKCFEARRKNRGEYNGIALQDVESARPIIIRGENGNDAQVPSVQRPPSESTNDATPFEARIMTLVLPPREFGSTAVPPNTPMMGPSHRRNNLSVDEGSLQRIIRQKRARRPNTLKLPVNTGV